MTKRRKRKTKTTNQLDLYKTKVSVDIMVMAFNQEEANAVAKKNVSQEFEYAKYESKKVNNVEEIPLNWSEAIPYYQEGEVVKKDNCLTLITTSSPLTPIKPADPVVEIAAPSPLVEASIVPLEENVKPAIQNMPVVHFNIPKRRKR